MAREMTLILRCGPFKHPRPVACCPARTRTVSPGFHKTDMDDTVPRHKQCPFPAGYPVVSSRPLRTGSTRQTWAVVWMTAHFRRQRDHQVLRETSPACLQPKKDASQHDRNMCVFDSKPTGFLHFPLSSPEAERRALMNSSAESLHSSAQLPAAAVSSGSHKRRVNP